MQPSPHFEFPPKWLVLAVLAVCLWTGPVNADSAARRIIDFQKDGIRFQIKAAIKADPATAYAGPTGDRSRASLAVKLRISSHARESQFFGVVSRNFSVFSPSSGSAEKLFWQDTTCHQRRGLPKTTVVAIDGSITRDGTQIQVHARPRQLGLLLPKDEITQGIQFAPKDALIAYRSRSTSSGLLVDVKIYAFDCDLTVTRGPPGHDDNVRQRPNPVGDLRIENRDRGP